MTSLERNTQLQAFLPSAREHSPLTMSSVEIAELTGKNHAHVMRDIRSMLTGMEQGQSKFGSTYSDAQGKSRACFNLPKRETLILVSGYSVELRARIIDRWMELERVAQPIAIDFSNPAVLLGVMSHLQAQVVEKDAVIAHQSKRLTKLDRIEGAVGNITVTEAAKVLKVKPGFLRKFLQEKRWIYKRPNSGHWLAYQALMPKYLDHRDHTYNDDDGGTHFVSYAVITPAGVVKLSAMIEAHFSAAGEPA